MHSALIGDRRCGSVPRIDWDPFRAILLELHPGVLGVAGYQAVVRLIGQRLVRNRSVSNTHKNLFERRRAWFVLATVTISYCFVLNYGAPAGPNPSRALRQDNKAIQALFLPVSLKPGRRPNESQGLLALAGDCAGRIRIAVKNDDLRTLRLDRRAEPRLRP